MFNDPDVPSVEEYKNALLAIEHRLTDTRMKILKTHYAAPKHNITAREMAYALGFEGYQGANSNYGKLAGLLGEILHWQPDDHIKMYVMVDFEHVNDEWHWIMRPQLVQALEELEWVSSSIDKRVATSPMLLTDEEYTVHEGNECFRQHTERERKPELIRRKKEQAIHQSNVLQCEVCGFVFSALYGELGEGYIECHHRKPLSEYVGEQETTLVDLALVCANCHRMLHRSRDGITVERLQEIVQASRTD